MVISKYTGTDLIGLIQEGHEGKYALNGKISIMPSGMLDIRESGGSELVVELENDFMDACLLCAQNMAHIVYFQFKLFLS